MSNSRSSLSLSSSSSSLDNPLTLLEIKDYIEKDKHKSASKLMIHTAPRIKGKLVSNPLVLNLSEFKLIQFEMDVDETMDMQSILKERKKHGFIDSDKLPGDCALNALFNMDILQLNDVNVLWPVVKSKGLYPEYIRKIFYHYYRERDGDAYMPDIYILFTYVNTTELLQNFLESLRQTLREKHYTIIGGNLKPSGGHAFLVGKENDKLIFKDPQNDTGWRTKEELMVNLEDFKDLQLFIERDVGMDRLKKERERERKRQRKKLGKISKKRKHNQSPSLKRRSPTPKKIKLDFDDKSKRFDNKFQRGIKTRKKGKIRKKGGYRYSKQHSLTKTRRTRKKSSKKTKRQRQ